jgi:hypothetical protein
MQKKQQSPTVLVWQVFWAVPQKALLDGPCLLFNQEYDNQSTP